MPRMSLQRIARLSESRRRYRPVLLVLISVTAVVLAACGDSDSSSPESQSDVPSASAGSVASLVPEDMRGKTLTIGLPPGDPPKTDYTADRKSFEGVDVDLGEAMAPLMGVDFSYEATTFDAIIPAIQSGQLVIGMSGFYVTEERMAVVDEVTYMKDAVMLVSKKDGPTGLTPDTLCGLAVATVKGSVMAEDLTTRSKACEEAGDDPIEVQVYAEDATATLALESGRADVAAASAISGGYLIKTKPDDFQLAGETYDPVLVGFLLEKDSELSPAVEAAIDELIANGTYADIMEKWGLSESTIDNSEISPTPN